MTDRPPDTTSPPDTTWPLRLYGLGMRALTPAVPLLLRRRATRGKEDVERLGERMGRPGRARPPGPLVWLHGASIGESVSLLGIAAALVARGLPVLATSGTRTSADILARRLPPGARHQYMPVDAPRFVEAFLDHWRPDLAVFAESELWPNTVRALARRGVPLALVNARLSERSFARWQRAPATARALLGTLAVCAAQTEGDARRFGALGAPAFPAGNLKYDLAPPPADPALVEAMAGRLAGRPVWMAASTHPGEEAAVLHAHRTLAPAIPGLLTILAPRHPHRGDALAEEAGALDLTVTRRSRGGDLSAAIHLVDTAGELGLFYRLAPLVFMGGSLVPHGGQNPIEPACLGAAVLHGPHVGNFTDVYAALDAAGGAHPVADAAALTESVGALLRSPRACRDRGRAAAACVGRLGGALGRTLEALAPLLPPRRDPAEALW